jgi:hypothetical protein
VIGLDADIVAMGATGNQINLANPGSLAIIYTNNTSRPVALVSIILQSVFQTNSIGSSPDATLAATVTAGTADGGYRDIIGVTDSSIANTRLYAANQAKTLYPDMDAPTPVIKPGQSVYLQVIQPASSPILVQMAVAKIQGLFL